MSSRGRSTLLATGVISLVWAGCSSGKPGAGFSEVHGGSGSGGPAGSPTFGGEAGVGGVAGGCNPNPLNYDFPGNGCDDDGDGAVDNPPAACDASLPLNGDAAAFARALGVCQLANGANDVRWGLVSASYVTSYSAGGSARGPARDLDAFRERGATA